VARAFRKIEVLVVAFASAAFAVSFTYPLLKHLQQNAPGADRDYFTETAWAAAHTINHFWQLPFWDPYKCGGEPLLADPQARIITLFFLLHLVCGPVAAIKLELAIHLAIAFAGGYFLGRLIGLRYVPAAVCASVFPCSSWIYLHFAAAHFTFVPGLYLPWVLSMWMLSVEGRRLLPAAVGGLLLALMYTEGAFYILSFAVPLFAAVALVAAAQRRELWPAVAGLLMGMFAVGFASIKLLPTLALHISRGTASTEIESLGMLAQELFSRNQNAIRTLNGMEWSFFEYGAYVGPFFASFVVIGVLCDRRRAMPWIVAAAVTFVFSLGSPVWWAPWPLLHRLPIYDFQHVPSRFLIIFVLALAPLAGIGAETLCSKGKLWTAITAVILAAAVGDCWKVNYINVMLAMAGEMSGPPPPAPQFRQFWEPSGRETFSVARSNQGAVNCYFAPGTNVKGYNQSGYRGEQYLLGDGSTKLINWTPNALDFDVDVPSSVIMIVNQNYDSGWRVRAGKGVVFPRDRLVAVLVPAGRQHLVLSYRSDPFEIGLAITMITFVAMLIIWRYEHRHP
jgi:hypothetical protein